MNSCRLIRSPRSAAAASSAGRELDAERRGSYFAQLPLHWGSHLLAAIEIYQCGDEPLLRELGRAGFGRASPAHRTAIVSDTSAR